MIINKALQEFKEKYDRDAIQSIINLSDDITLYKSSFNGFNLTESVSNFKTYIEGFSEYSIKTENTNNKRSNNVLLEHTKLVIENKSEKIKLFNAIKIPFTDASKFVQEYVDSIDILLEMVDSNQSTILESTDDVDSSGCVLQFTEMFLDKMNDNFYPVMEHLLQSSGYYSRKRLREPLVKEETEYNFFL